MRKIVLLSYCAMVFSFLYSVIHLVSNPRQVYNPWRLTIVVSLATFEAIGSIAREEVIVINVYL